VNELAADPFSVVHGKQPAAWKVLVYSNPGVGKSTWAALAPKHIFLDLENGLARVDCTKTPHQLKSYEEVVDWLRWFIKSEYQTVVIDTVDELEKFLSAKVVATWNQDNKKVTTVADIPYGRGGDLLVARWRDFIAILDHVHATGKNVLLLGHEQIVKFENPTGANYDFYTVNIHKKAAPVVMAKLDGVFFARIDTYFKGEKDGKGKAVAAGERVLYTTQGGSFVAKSRFDLPDSLPLDGAVFSKLI